MFGKKSNYINGAWIEGEGEINNINPSDTNDLIDTYSNASSNQLNNAVSSAKVAQKKWEKVGIEKRANILNDIGSEQDKYYKKYIEYKKNGAFGIAEMDSAKQILNMTYPISGDINKKTIQKAYGKLGLIGGKAGEKGGIMYMKKNDKGVYKFEYNEERRQYMNIFEKPELKKYSGKIDNNSSEITKAY